MGEHTAKATNNERDKKPHETTAAATDVPTNAHSCLDFIDLDTAFGLAKGAQATLMDRRASAIREVFNTLNEEDSPDISDDIMGSLAVAAISLASNIIASTLAKKLLADTESVLGNAITSAFADGMQDAGSQIRNGLKNNRGSSQAAFFGSQEQGLLTLKQKADEHLSKAAGKIKTKIASAEETERPNLTANSLKGAETFRIVTNASGEAARQVQFEHSLAKWMNARAQGKLGQTHSNHTFLGKAVDMSPPEHYSKKGAAGVIYVAFGSHPARRPFSASGKGGSIKVAGLTSAARERIRDTPIKDLGMPIIATGYIYDGFLDGMSLSGNEISFGRNEGGGHYAHGDRDAMEGLKKAANKTNANEAAKVILDEDLGMATLANARLG